MIDSYELCFLISKLRVNVENALLELPAQEYKALPYWDRVAGSLYEEFARLTEARIEDWEEWLTKPVSALPEDDPIHQRFIVVY